jgi:hypothetical protein
MPSPRTRSINAILLPLALALALPAAAQVKGEAPPLPAWEQLTEAQRAALVAPIRERWNAHPEKREHMLAHAERWQEMDPEQRARARRGAERWRQMDPEKREAMRALYARLRTLPQAERNVLRVRWRAMTPEQRREWVEDNPPPAETHEDRDR